MKLVDILSGYPESMLDRLASDKVDEVAGLRLPGPVLVQEVARSLSSMSYVARALAPTRPPTYAMICLLLEAPDQAISGEGFRERVLDLTESLSERASNVRGLRGGRQVDLYLEMLWTAWENDGEVDRSEALLLDALREKLGLWPREHHLLEHHPRVRPLWEGPRAFDMARNHLLSTGIILTHENAYVMGDEVATLVRQLWDIALTDSAYRRLLGHLTTGQLRDALAAFDLPLSGTKLERAERLVSAMIPPAATIDTLHLDQVKDISRVQGLPVSLNKADLVEALIEHFDLERDLAEETEDDSALEPAPEPEPEARELDDSSLSELLHLLTVDQLHDILRKAGLRLSGSKSERVSRLVQSPWNERTMLSHLTKSDLVRLCRGRGLPVSGVKSEIVDRLLESPGFADGEGKRSEPVVPASTDLDAIDQTPKPPHPPAVLGLRDIQVDYPELDRAQQNVVALLARARSLSERELERAVAQHDLPWFLIKAHMADLISRLSEHRSAPLHVRSAGGHNIYEWMGERGTGRMERTAARDVIDALRNGVVPERHLDLLAVGQEAARHHLVDLLEHVTTERSEFKFVRGPYGAGKTFITAWLREAAFELGFAVSTVRVGPDQPLSDLPVFYSGMVQGLRTPENRGASALADVLEAWLLSVHDSVAAVEGLEPGSPLPEALSERVEEAIQSETGRIGDLDPSFSKAVYHFYRARSQGDTDTAGTVLSWLRGSRSLSASSLRQIGVRGTLDPECVFAWMRALLHVVRGGRLRGLLLIVDELELVRRFPHARQRERAYETLRLLVDEAGENGLPGCLMVFTGTDALFEDRQYGLGSYEALSNRIETPTTHAGRTSVRQPVVDLEPLDTSLLLAVARRVREIHMEAYGWDPQQRFGDEALEEMIAAATAFGEEQMGRLPRPFLRELVHALDLCEENPGIEAADCLRRQTEAPGAAATVLGILEESP